MPSLSFRELCEHKAKKLLVNVHSCGLNILGWEILLKLFFIEIEVLLLHFASVEPCIPFVINGVRVFSLLSLKINKSLFVLLSKIDQSSNKIIFKNLNILWRFGHSSLQNHL